MLERRNRLQPWLDRFQQHPTLPQMLADKGYLSFQSGKWWGGPWTDGGFTGGMNHGAPERSGRHGEECLKIGREELKPVVVLIEDATTIDKPFNQIHAHFHPNPPHHPTQTKPQKHNTNKP